MKTIKSLIVTAKTFPDVIPFFLFLLSFPLSIRKVIVYFPIAGTFNEYSGIYLYLSDIFLTFTFIFWFFLSRNKINVLSIKTFSFRPIGKIVPLLILPIFLVILSFFSLIWAKNELNSLYRSIKLAESVLLYLYIMRRIVPILKNEIPELFHVEQPYNETTTIVPRGTMALKNIFLCVLLALLPATLFDHYLWDIWPGQSIFWITLGLIAGLKLNGTSDMKEKVPRGTTNVFKISLMMVILNGSANSLIGITQFLLQHSIGLIFLKESLISPDMSGVAKIIFESHRTIRAYGLFPHPNILGGFLILSIFSSLFYRKMFHVERSKLLIDLSIAVQFACLIFTFSKSAMLGIAIPLFLINVPRETKHLKGFIKKIAAPSLLIIILVSWFVIKTDKYAFFIQSIKERLLFLNVSRGTIIENPIIGIGTGEFVNNFYRTMPALNSWEYQPVHDVFLLIWSELGALGLAVFLLFLFSLFTVNREKPLLFTK